MAVIKGGKASVHSVVDEHYRPIRNRANDYLIDREGQRTRSFTGVQGISEQDAHIQDSQGPMYDRTEEHLGTTDAAIIEFRRLMPGDGPRSARRAGARGGAERPRLLGGAPARRWRCARPPSRLSPRSAPSRGADRGCFPEAREPISR